jgi:hypothetical protein
VHKELFRFFERPALRPLIGKRPFAGAMWAQFMGRLRKVTLLIREK